MRPGVRRSRDPIVFAPWFVLLDRGEPCDSCLPATHRMLEFPCSVLSTGAVDSSPRRGVVFLFFPMLYHQSTSRGDLGDEVDGMKGDTIKLLNDDDNRPKRGSHWNSRKTCVTRVFVLLTVPQQAGKLTGALGRKRRRRLQWASEAIERGRCPCHVQFYELVNCAWCT